MTDHHDPVDDVLGLYMDFLDGDGEYPDISPLTADERTEFERTAVTLRELRAQKYEPPTLDDDPVARALGFDRAGSDVMLSPTKLRNRRQAAGLKVAQLAEALNNAGYPTTSAQVFDYERQSVPVPVELVGLLAAILDTAVSELEDESTILDDFAAFLADPAFESELNAWLAGSDDDPAVLRQEVTRELAGARFRNVRHSRDQWLALLRQLLEERRER